MYAIAPAELCPTLDNRPPSMSQIPMVLLLLLHGADMSPDNDFDAPASALDILVAKKPSGDDAAAAAPPERDEAKADDGGAKATLARLLLWGGTFIGTRSEVPLEALLNPGGDLDRARRGFVSYLPVARPQLPAEEVMKVLPFAPESFKDRARRLLLSLHRLRFPKGAASVVVHHLVIDCVEAGEPNPDWDH
jgi:hypothetical protein